MGRHGEPEARPYLHRWTVNQKTGSVSEEELDDRPVDFPRIRDDRVGLKYRYGYAVGFSDDDLVCGRRFHKYDLEGSTSQIHELAPGCEAAEPVFVRAAGHSAEDDGWVLAYVYDKATDRSQLVILDATEFDKEPVARIHLPGRVPAGFHGSWLPDVD